MAQYKESYLEVYLDDFRFLDPECHDTRVREINMRTKRCNRCLGFNECKMHPHFWLFGEPTRVEENEFLPDDADEAKTKARHVAPYQKVREREPFPINDLPT
jgi:hypothetical protein